MSTLLDVPFSMTVLHWVFWCEVIVSSFDFSETSNKNCWEEDKTEVLNEESCVDDVNICIEFECWFDCKLFNIWQCWPCNCPWIIKSCWFGWNEIEEIFNSFIKQQQSENEHDDNNDELLDDDDELLDDGRIR